MTPGRPAPAGARRMLLTICAMSATLMQSLDTTIAAPRAVSARSAAAVRTWARPRGVSGPASGDCPWIRRARFQVLSPCRTSRMTVGRVTMARLR